MQATITIPEQIRNIPVELKKTNKDIYFQENTGKFYKITLLEPLTMFIGNDAVTRQNLVMTKYHPAYLVLHEFSLKSKISINQIPRYLNLSQFQQFGDIQQEYVQMNKNKVFEFLEKRINAVIDLVQAKSYNKVVKQFSFANKENSTDKKLVSPEVLQLLKKDIPDLFLSEILILKYVQQKIIKPVVLDTFNEELDKQDQHEKQKLKKKATSKPKMPEPLPKNQTTLLQFSGKK